MRHKIIKFLKLFCSFSDEGEDKLLLQIFQSRGIRKGTYLDIGAYSPVKVSNTLLLYIWGWKGTCVDITPKWKWLLRPRDRYIYGYVDANISYRVKNRVWTSDAEIAYYNRKYKMKIKYDVPKIDVSELPTGYTLLDLDVDGIDLRVIKKLLAIYKPPFILAEDKALKIQEGIYDFLISEGYTRIASTTRNGIYEMVRNV